MNQIDTIQKGLDTCPLFDVFNTQEKRQIAQVSMLKFFKKGELVFSTVQDTHFFVVYSGVLSLRLKTRKVKKYERGSIFGEISIFTKKTRLGNIKTITDTTLVAIDAKKIFNDTLVDASVQLKLLKQLTELIVSYFYEDNSLLLKDLILNGESHTCEFKESLNAKNKAFKEKIVKTLSAFMNLDGGSILFGVRDDGYLLGIRDDNAAIDVFIRNLIDVINFRLGEYFSSLIEFSVEEIDGKRVVRIDCEKSMSPVFYKGANNQEEFVIRTATRNKVLTKTSDIVKYYQENFNG